MSLKLTEEILRKGPKEYFGELRRKTKLSRVNLAKEAGVTKYFLGCLESNENQRWITMWYMEKLLTFYKNYLGLNDDEILSYTDAITLCREWQRSRLTTTNCSSWTRQRLTNILGNTHVFKIEDEKLLEDFLDILEDKVICRSGYCNYYHRDNIKISD